MKHNILVLTLISSIFIFISSASSCKNASTSDESLMDSITLKKAPPAWAKNANIYEVNIRQYTPEGTFKAFQRHLPRLKKMGIDILWLMPINPIGIKNRKGSLGSYYSVKDYIAVNPEFGTENDFKILVREAHQLGMRVIIDWVANHTAWDNVWIKPHPDWYTQDSLGNIIIPKGTDWEDTADLNYDNPHLRRAMIDAMKYWVKNADIDGFRCDVAGMIPITFWLHARKELDEQKKDLFFLAEDGEPEIYKAFDMSYDWPLKDIMNGIAKGEKNASDIAKHFTEEETRFKPEDIRMHFITNHDENTWSGNEYERLKSPEAVDAFTVLTYVIPGMQLTYTGQEEPMRKRLKFFDKDTVGFKNYERQAFISNLNLLKHKNNALWSTNYNTLKLINNNNPNNILSFFRIEGDNKIFSIFNFSPSAQTVKLNDKIEGDFKKHIGVEIDFNKNTEIKLAPWQFSIYITK